MAEYIEREKLMAFPIRIDHCDKENGSLDFVLGIETVLEYAEYIPAADVVPVVRCKDCVCWERARVNKKGFLICPASGMEITYEDFCSYGERRVDNATD